MGAYLVPPKNVSVSLQVLDARKLLVSMSTRVDAMSVVGSLLLLEHINLNVGDAGVAARFFVDGLGGCADPARAARRQSMHVNMGPLCQFHTASPVHEARIAEEGPQVRRKRALPVRTGRRITAGCGCARAFARLAARSLCVYARSE